MNRICYVSSRQTCKLHLQIAKKESWRVQLAVAGERFMVRLPTLQAL